jgi:hypothetical protein
MTGDPPETGQIPRKIGRIPAWEVAMIGGIPSFHLRVDRLLIRRRSVMSKNQTLAVFSIVLLSVVAIAACAPSSPEERVAELRSRYEARVNSFYVEAEPLIVEAIAEPEVAEEDAALDEVAEGEAMEEGEAEIELIQNAHLDLIIQHDANEMLPGITVEIFMVDAAENEKGRWQLWIDTSTLRKANHLQLSHILEDVPYVEGDGFAAEIRVPIPAAERGGYREFSLQE